MKTKQLVHCGVFTALLIICAWLSFPLGRTPITLQTFGLFLCLGTLGGKRGTIAILTYLTLGAVGFPAFSGFRGGISVLLDANGGYLLGFLAAGLVYWLITALCGSSPAVKLSAMVTGLLVCYAFGSLWFSLLYLQEGNVVTMAFILLNCVLPYLLPDGIKLVLAWQLSSRLSRFLNR